jgi:hypothetical protein
MMNENVIVMLIYQVYREYILQVPHQKKVRISNFIKLYSDVLLYFGTNCQLALIQNEVKTLQSNL